MSVMVPLARSWSSRRACPTRQDGAMLRRPAALAALLAALLAVTLAAQAHGTDQHGARVVAFTIPSRLVHATMPVAAVVPPGAGAGRPLLVFLHGFGASQSSYLTDAMFAALARLG